MYFKIYNHIPTNRYNNIVQYKENEPQESIKQRYDLCHFPEKKNLLSD